ncbi:hypothetical protein ACNF40_08505, partial [Cuniculiplasma sp. SKW4]
IQKLGLLGINITENERLMEPSFEDKTAVLSMMRDLILLSNDIQYIEEISDVEQKTLEDV